MIYSFKYVFFFFYAKQVALICKVLNVLSKIKIKQERIALYKGDVRDL